MTARAAWGTALGALLLGALAAAGCATTLHDRAAPSGLPPGRADQAAAPLPGEPAGPLERTVYVGAFGLGEAAAREWPELTAAGVGLGLAQRIADAVFATGGFRLLEEKAEVVARLAEGLARSGGAPESAPPPEAPWLLYGEVAEVRVRQHEEVRGLVDRGSDQTEVTVELRLVERASARVRLATGRGAVTSRSTRSGGLDALAVAEATGLAVAAATAKLAPAGGSPR